MLEIDKGTVTRYCKPSTLDDNGMPTSSSYQLREKEKCLSVYLLNFFDDPTEEERVEKVKIEMKKRGFKSKKTGLLSTLDIEDSKNYVESVISEQIIYKECREQDLPHCGIFHDPDDLLISELLSHRTKNCYAAV